MQIYENKNKIKTCRDVQSSSSLGSGWAAQALWSRPSSRKPQYTAAIINLTDSSPSSADQNHPHSMTLPLWEDFDQVMSDAWFLADATPGIQAKHLHFCFSDMEAWL